MRVINKLRTPGVIRSVRLEEDIVQVTTDKEVIIYRRELDVHTESKESFRRSSLHKGP